jgi:hypothetical protein
MADSKKSIEEKKAQLMRLTTDFSQQNLNEEYDKVIEKLISKMARKRDVPFAAGKIEIWAAAVIHALGTINFLFDKVSEPYASVTDICKFFNTKQSTTTQKSKKIRDMFKMAYFDGEFSTETVDQHNPLHDLTMINGLFVPKDMVQIEGDQEVDVEKWELEVAQILGVTGLKDENDMVQLLEVTYESLMKFYRYLEQHLTFPFMATLEEEVGPFEIREHDVDCIRLDQELKVDEFYGIMVECKEGGKNSILPLVDIIFDEEHENYALVELYDDWFWKYR